MENLHVSRLENKDGEVHWVLYEQGHFNTPIKILTDHEAEKLINEFSRQALEDNDGQRDS